MTFFIHLSSAFSSYKQAIRFIAQNHLKRYFLFPAFINIILFWVGFEFIDYLTDLLLQYLHEVLNTSSWRFTGSNVLSKIIDVFIWLIGKIFTFLVFIFVGGHIVLILMSPVLAYVSEKTEKITDGTDYPFNLKQFFSDIIRGIAISIRNFAIEIFFIILFFFIGLIPIIGLVAAPTLFIVSSYYYGFSFLDYNLERKRFAVKDSIQFMKQNRGLAIGNGIVFTLLLMIPVLGLSLASFGAIISTVAASISLSKKNDSDRDKL